ncbi:MAG: T9SS type A sorting domain-containing protein [Bacteroidales bacterium]|nr:T9SS type A sorting domain-containing protein [Bacteroidales bacterium]
MRVTFLFICSICWCILPAQTIPYNTAPDWISTAGGQYATGLGLADINGDGFKDLVVANGNDMARQRLVVYYNQGDGTFPLLPDWQSADIDYHGHLACGDLNGNGNIDVVVSVYIGPAGFSSPGKIKIYYNQGNELESLPSFESESFYSFSCALGDADGDGDLDIAVATGEPYSNILDNGRIFINHNGTFQAVADWQSTVSMGGIDVEFGDFNRDGLMDVIFVTERTPNYIYLADSLGNINPEPAWQSDEALNFLNSVDVGYPGDQSIIVMTENSQLGGSGRVRKYDFSDPVPAGSVASWYSNPFGYGSGILLNDVNLDGHLDLIYGGWWLPVKIALGDGTGFELTPSYTSSTNSVVEAILMADLGREDITMISETFTIQPHQHLSHVIILGKQITEEILSFKINSEELAYSQYCWVPGKNRISIATPLTAGSVVEVVYTYSPYPDMVITNWDSNKGNYIFYNTLGGTIGIADRNDHHHSLTIYPNPAGDFVKISSEGIMGPVILDIYNIHGQNVLSLIEKRFTGQLTIDVSTWPHGIYFVKMNQRSNSATGTFIK